MKIVSIIIIKGNKLIIVVVNNEALVLVNTKKRKKELIIVSKNINVPRRVTEGIDLYINYWKLQYNL